ncbi:MAG: YicC family protein [Gammaproteobacteria bacterium]|nr:YicC family protein [Gammaproteobacteria bacterium]
MLRSMTAFARVQESNDAGSVTWEIRSVNHRYLEPGIKLPEEFKLLEPEVRKQVSEYLTRGKLDIGLRYRLNHSNLDEIVLNQDIVRNLRQVEQEVLNIVHEGDKMSVADILGWPGVIAEAQSDMSSLLELARNGLKKALAQLVESRLAEGQALAKLIATRCNQVTEITIKLREHRPAMITSMHEKWKSNIEEKLQKWVDSVNEGRLEQELAILAQKLDVDEELDRIDTHIAEVEKVLKRKEAVGRRLDFLMQELNREANTLASKSQDSMTTQWSVDLKVLIEQMREQVQNIE